METLKSGTNELKCSLGPRMYVGGFYLTSCPFFKHQQVILGTSGISLFFQWMVLSPFSVSVLSFPRNSFYSKLLKYKNLTCNFFSLKLRCVLLMYNPEGFLASPAWELSDLYSRQLVRCLAPSKHQGVFSERTDLSSTHRAQWNDSLSST